MSIHEIVGEFRKRPAAASAGAVLSSLLIMAGCGESSGIASCSPEYYRDNAPVKRADALADMQFGTFALKGRIGFSDQLDSNVAITNIPPRLRPAAEDVFRVDPEASAAKGQTVLNIGNSHTDTNLDEIGEIVCSGNGGEYFPTAAASEAYADFYAAGIDVNPAPVGSSK